MGEGLKEIRLAITTDGNGDATVTSPETTNGWLYAVQWDDGDLVDGVDAVLTLSGLGTGADVTVLTLTDTNVDKWFYPRILEHDETGADLTTRTFYAIDGSLKVVVSDGGDTKSGTVLIRYFQ